MPPCRCMQRSGFTVCDSRGARRRLHRHAACSPQLRCPDRRITGASYKEFVMNREIVAERIIQDHTTYALAAGAIPIPLADIASVAAVQLDVVRALAKVYEVEFDPAAAKGLIASIIGASAARFGASIDRKSVV